MGLEAHPLALPFPHPQPQRTWRDAEIRFKREGKNWKSPRTLELQEVLFAWLSSRLQHLVLPAIDGDLIDALVVDLVDSDRKPSTINRYLNLLRAVLNAAVSWRWLAFVPKVPHVKDRAKRVRFLTWAEAMRLLQELPPHLSEMAMFSLETGLRRSNVTYLTWSQVDLRGRLAWIHADQSKGRRSIPVPLSPTACSILERNRGTHREYVFTYRGEPVKQTSTKAWRAALDRAGIKNFRWHDLRHTWASWHAQAGTPVHVLRELGGWSDDRMVKNYAHLSVQHLLPHVERVHDLLRQRSLPVRAETHRGSVSAASRARSRKGDAR